MEKTEVSSSELDKEKIAQRRSYSFFRREEEYWRIKSCSLCLKAGDRNTTYFHRKYRACLSCNHIVEIVASSGQMCKGTEQIKEAASSHFQKLLSAEGDGCDEDINDFLAHISILVNTEDNNTLLKPFSEEEISKIVWSMDSDKAPGPNGFSIHFYILCWDIIKIDLLRMIQGFMRKSKVGGGINSTFLALIPKEVNPRSFERYRLISLCNASYKILAKLLANRIKPLLQKLISPAQEGFMKGRNTLDNVIQVEEALHSSHYRKEQGMLIKLDMSNAFDRVTCFFLYRVLHSFGFNQEFINLIKACTWKVWIVPLVNGRPANYFQATKGLRQGCPLSPFLYILMADTLSRRLSYKKYVGNIPGIRIVKGVDLMNHALFTDDSLMLGGASIRMENSFKVILNKLCSIFGALINERKSVIYGWNTEQDTIDRIANLLGFAGFASWEKIKYLGLPLTLGSNRNNLWEEIIAKFKKKIAVWGGY